MRRPLWIAFLSSVTLCVGAGLLVSKLGTGVSAGGTTEDARDVLAGGVSTGVVHSLNPGRNPGSVLGPATTVSGSGTPPSHIDRRSHHDSSGARGAPGTSSGVDGSAAGAGNVPEGSAGETALDPLQPLRGMRLTVALEEALEDGDLAVLQGLLISELTMDGTQFGADDLPMLFDALAEVDDYGLQNLLLTHLDRVDVPGEEKVTGYLDYLQNSEHPMHSEAVFKKLVDLGGDQTLHGLTEIVRSTEDRSLRRQAVEALGGLKDPRAVPTLERALTMAEDARTARPYAEALARIGGNAAIGSLVDFASRSGNEAALSAILSVKDPSAAKLLAEALNGRVSEAYEKTALRKLQQLGDPGALRDLDRYLRQASDPMARLTLSAIGRIRDSKASDLLEDYAARERNPQLAEFAAKTARSLRKRLEQPPREKAKPWKEPRVKREKEPKRSGERRLKSDKPKREERRERKRDRRA